MSKAFRRVPKGYDGTDVTTKNLKDVLSHVLAEVTEVYSERPDLVLASWPDIIGPKLAPLTKAVSMNNGVLVVIVKNSTLYSLLSQHEKARILRQLKQKFPNHDIRNIQFRMG